MSSPLELEEAWYRADVAGLDLLESPGPFTKVTSQLSELAQGRAQLLLTVISSLHQVATKTGERRIDHEMAALVLWPLGAAGRAHVNQVSLDAAVDVVVARAMGTVDDRCHGGRWWLVGPVSVEYPPPIQLLAAGNPDVAAGTTNIRSVRYTVTEWR